MLTPTYNERMILLSLGLYPFGVESLETIINMIDTNPDKVLMDGKIVDHSTQKC